jgi:ParB family chromosome partitioning protein
MALDLSALQVVPDGAEELALKAGEPLILAVHLIDEDPDNPRTEFPPSELAELAEDIRQRGVLQPIVVAPPGPRGHYMIRFGAKRLRASKLAGKDEVPVVVYRGLFDAYAQVAENLKRHGLSALDLARFMQRRFEAGDSKATIARRLLVDQTTVTHYLALLTLPPVLDAALTSGRCTAPRTLYELARLHEDHPDQVARLVASGEEITRAAVARLRDPVATTAEALPKAPRRAAEMRQQAEPLRSSTGSELVLQAEAIWPQLEQIIDQLKLRAPANEDSDSLLSVRRRLYALAKR